MPRRTKTDRLQINVRMREELRAKIEESARQNDVSMNAEVVNILERHFQKEENMFGSIYVSALIRALGVIAKVIEDQSALNSTQEDEVRHEVKVAFLAQLGAFNPLVLGNYRKQIEAGQRKLALETVAASLRFGGIESPQDIAQFIFGGISADPEKATRLTLRGSDEEEPNV